MSFNVKDFGRYRVERRKYLPPKENFYFRKVHEFPMEFLCRILLQKCSFLPQQKKTPLGRAIKIGRHTTSGLN